MSQLTRNEEKKEERFPNETQTQKRLTDEETLFHSSVHLCFV